MPELIEIKLFNRELNELERLFSFVKIVKNKKIYIKILELEIKIFKILFSIILKKEYIQGKIKTIYLPKKKKEKITKNFLKRRGIKKELKEIFNFLNFENFHEKSALEFLKNDKLVFIDEIGKMKILPIEKLINYFSFIRIIRENIEKEEYKG
jgi:hypothetical protein